MSGFFVQTLDGDVRIAQGQYAGNVEVAIFDDDEERMLSAEMEPEQAAQFIVAFQEAVARAAVALEGEDGGR